MLTVGQRVRYFTQDTDPYTGAKGIVAEVLHQADGMPVQYKIQPEQSWRRPIYLSERTMWGVVAADK